MYGISHASCLQISLQYVALDYIIPNKLDAQEKYITQYILKVESNANKINHHLTLIILNI